MCGSLNQTLADLLSALTPIGYILQQQVVLKVGDFASCRHQRECVYVLVLSLTGTEPVRHAEVNLAYDILSSAESP